MANATDLFSAPLQIKFDPKVLKLNDVTQGNLMASDGQQVTFTKNIQNDTGEADITLNRLPGTGGITGSGMLVTLSFTTRRPRRHQRLRAGLQPQQLARPTHIQFVAAADV